jgi:hypothetical protein
MVIVLLGLAFMTAVWLIHMTSRSVRASEENWHPRSYAAQVDHVGGSPRRPWEPSPSNRFAWWNGR